MSASMVSMSEREKREIKSQLSSTIMENSKRHKTTLLQLYVSHSFNIFLSILFVTYTIFSYFTLMREADFGVRQSWTFSDILMDHPKKNFRLIPIIVLHAIWFLIATFFYENEFFNPFIRLYLFLFSNPNMSYGDRILSIFDPLPLRWQVCNIRLCN